MGISPFEGTQESGQGLEAIDSGLKMSLREASIRTILHHPEVPSPPEELISDIRSTRGKTEGDETREGNHLSFLGPSFGFLEGA